MREPGLLLVHTMIECRGKMCTTAHMNFDDELIMNKTHKCVKSGFFLFTLIRAGKCTFNAQCTTGMYYSPRGLWCCLWFKVFNCSRLFQVVIWLDSLTFPLETLLAFRFPSKRESVRSLTINWKRCFFVLWSVARVHLTWQPVKPWSNHRFKKTDLTRAHILFLFLSQHVRVIKN